MLHCGNIAKESLDGQTLHKSRLACEFHWVCAWFERLEMTPSRSLRPKKKIAPFGYLGLFSLHWIIRSVAERMKIIPAMMFFQCRWCLYLSVRGLSAKLSRSLAVGSYFKHAPLRDQFSTQLDWHLQLSISCVNATDNFSPGPNALKLWREEFHVVPGCGKYCRSIVANFKWLLTFSCSPLYPTAM